MVPLFIRKLAVSAGMFRVLFCTNIINILSQRQHFVFKNSFVPILKVWYEKKSTRAVVQFTGPHEIVQWGIQGPRGSLFS